MSYESCDDDASFSNVLDDAFRLCDFSYIDRPLPM